MQIQHQDVICPVCGVTFKTQQAYRSHQNKKGGCIDKRVFHCIGCDGDFASKFSLQRHTVVCKKRSPDPDVFHCAACNKYFANKFSLQRHGPVCKKRPVVSAQQARFEVDSLRYQLVNALQENEMFRADSDPKFNDYDDLEVDVWMLEAHRMSSCVFTSVLSACWFSPRKPYSHSVRLISEEPLRFEYIENRKWMRTRSAADNCELVNKLRCVMDKVVASKLDTWREATFNVALLTGLRFYLSAEDEAGMMDYHLRLLKNVLSVFHNGPHLLA